MILGGDRMAAISDDLVRVMSRASQRDSAIRQRDNALFMGEMGRELSWPLLQQLIGHGRGSSWIISQPTSRPAG